LSSTDFRLNGLDEYTDDAILTEIRRVAALVSPGHMTKSLFKTHANVGYSTVCRHFGTWRNALSAAGLRHLINTARPVTDKMVLQLAKGMSDDALLSILRDVARKIGRESFTVEEFNQHAQINAATLCRRFDGWGTALQRAELNPAKGQRRYSDDECFENLLNVWTHYGRRPKYEEMPQPPSIIGVRPYITRWGTWRKALRAFVDRINNDLSANAREEATPSGDPQSESVSNHRHPDSAKADSEKRAIKIGMRYQILKRDHFRCVICGRSPATTLGLELHVDHIVPFSQTGAGPCWRT
jgi:Homing endonuclease associated repeat